MVNYCSPERPTGAGPAETQRGDLCRADPTSRRTDAPQAHGHLGSAVDAGLALRRKPTGRMVPRIDREAVGAASPGKGPSWQGGGCEAHVPVCGLPRGRGCQPPAGSAHTNHRRGVPSLDHEPVHPSHNHEKGPIVPGMSREHQGSRVGRGIAGHSKTRLYPSVVSGSGDSGTPGEMGRVDRSRGKSTPVEYPSRSRPAGSGNCRNAPPPVAAPPSPVAPVSERRPGASGRSTVRDNPVRGFWRSRAVRPCSTAMAQHLTL
jgi:hypothetical protein